MSWVRSPDNPLGRGMVAWVIRFVHLLRRGGIKVSTAETLDALTALERVDLASRSQVKAALRATLLKDCDQVPFFDSVFELLTSETVPGTARPEARREPADPMARRVREALGLDDARMAIYSALPSSERDRIHDMLERVKGLHGSVSALKHIVEEHLDTVEALTVPRPAERRTGEESLDAAPARFARGMAGEGVSPLYRDLRGMSEADLPAMLQVARRLARRLAARISRRRVLSRRRQRVDIRRTVRANIQFGGVPFRLRYRARRQRKPRLVVVGDASGSMNQYFGFLALFLYGMARAAPGIELFVFSEDLERVTSGVREPGRYGEVLERLSAGVSQWGRGTNLGTSVATLLARYPQHLRRDTVVVIFSDTKTLSLDQAVLGVAEVRKRVRSVIWLNPLPSSQWSRVPSVTAFIRLVQMRECRSLWQLAETLCGIARAD